MEDIQRSRRLESGLIPDLLEAAAGAANVFAPVKLIQKLWRTGLEQFRSRYGKFAERFDDIAQMDEADLLTMLPRFLGLAVQAATERDGRYRLVCLFDGYDDSFPTRRDRSALWMLDFIEACASGLFVVFSRHPVQWELRDKHGLNVVSHHVIEPLGSADAAVLLEKLGVSEAGIRAEVVRFAGGNPLALEMCSEMVQSGVIDWGAAHRDRNAILRKVIERYLDHLDETRAYAVKACCVLQRFDQPYWEEACRSVGALIPTEAFDDFCRMAYAESAGLKAPGEVFRIRKAIRRHVLPSLDDYVVEKVVSSALSYVQRLQNSSSASSSWWLIEDLLTLTGERRLTLSQTQLRDLVESVLWLAHNGWCRQVATWLSRIPPAAREDGLTVAGWSFLMSACERRSGDLRAAQRRLDSIQVPAKSKAALGDHVDLLSALLQQKRGDYTLSGTKFLELAQRPSPPYFRWQPSVLARRKLAGQALVRGAFRDALQQLDDLDRLVVDAGPVWSIETLRLRGHVHRFNFQTALSDKTYREALALAADHGLFAARAKVMTNLAENSAWFEPAAAMEFAEEAIALNREISAHLEVGKALAAKALAAVFLGRHRESGKAAGESDNVMNKTGYTAGRLFAMRSQAMGLVWMGDNPRALAVRKAMRRLSRQLGVYGFIEAPISIAVGEEELPNIDIDWIDRTATLQFLQDLLLKWPIQKRS